MKMLWISCVAALLLACTGCQTVKGLFNDLSWTFHTLDQNIAEK